MVRRSSLLIVVCVAFALLFAVSLGVAQQGDDAKFVASKARKTYHLKDCRLAKRIKPENLVTFKTVEEAIQAGYAPCKVCKPPVPVKD